MAGPAVMEATPLDIITKKLKTTRKRNCGVLQGGNHYDRTTQDYINER